MIQKPKRPRRKKRKDERKKGHVAVSKDVVMIATLLGTFVMLKALFPLMYRTMRDYMIKYVSLAPLADTMTDYTTSIFWDMVIAIAKAAIPIILVIHYIGSDWNRRTDRISIYKK